MQRWTPERTADYASEYGFARVSTGAGYKWRLTCANCSKVIDFDFGPTINISEELVPVARSAKWIVQRGRSWSVRCPECQTMRDGRMKKIATNDEVVLALQSYGIRAGDRGGVPCWEAECGCGVLERVGQEYNPDLRTWTTTVIKRFTRIHWDITFGRPPRCPACARSDRGDPTFTRRDDRHMVIEGEVVGQIAALPAPVPQTAIAAAFAAATKAVAPVTAIGANPKATAMVHKLLAKHFDEDRGFYEADWDDDRVATESDAQVAFVASIRRDNYAELAEPPEMTALRLKIEATERVLMEIKEQFINLSVKTPQKRKRLTMDEEAKADAFMRLQSILKPS